MVLASDWNFLRWPVFKKAGETPLAGLGRQEVCSFRLAGPTQKGSAMIDDFDEDDEDAWPTHNSHGWYLIIFVCGVIAAAVFTYFLAG